jgi:hypothetical protein
VAMGVATAQKKTPWPLGELENSTTPLTAFMSRLSPRSIAVRARNESLLSLLTLPMNSTYVLLTALPCLLVLPSPPTSQSTANARWEAER